ncbi:alpha/beta-hydrolase [Collybia nuda]|uniref:Alpha/beta-hydrolase n=1 Tax=Collybia nuda TaxID=64659 RepID=A0A9P5YAA8_9AGAR|nr:alpha/beta-hydrolase [Collybia nuda]
MLVLLQLTFLFSSVLLLSSTGFAAVSFPVTKPVPRATISTLAPYTQFARAAYCPQYKLHRWECGVACNALTSFQPSLVAGDGNGIQTYFVGYWPPEKTVIVAHQGTDPTRLVSDLTDMNILLDPLNDTLFPDVPSNVKVHDGFRNEHALTAPIILAEVKKLFKYRHIKKVTVIGHSLGGALAELDALYLTLNLPANTSVHAVTYGTPRVGNLAFAKLIDKMVPNFRRINNKKDIVPIVPGRSMGFAHPRGELHILSPGKAIFCPGNDDAINWQCQIQTVPTVLRGSLVDHLGPYEGIPIGTGACT